MRSTLSIFVFVTACLVACGGSKLPAAEPAVPVVRAPVEPPVEPPAAAPVEPGPTKPVTNQSLVSIGLDPDALDRTTDPCDDFYQFACGGWIKRTEIAADKQRTYDYLLRVSMIASLRRAQELG